MNSWPWRPGGAAYPDGLFHEFPYWLMSHHTCERAIETWRAAGLDNVGLMTSASSKRFDRRGRSVRKAGDPRSDVEVDRDRIVHSHAFRRLQRKTQIVGVHTVDFFRTRLTHTIECAQLGRAIANRIHDDSWEHVVEARTQLPDLVEAACLAHDLGHPPFGHTGEAALDAVLRAEFGIRFEGNAQSFRIVTLLEPKKYRRVTSPVDRPLGLDLTRATLQAMSKYPWTERDPKADASNKFGCYDNPDDREYFSWLWADMPTPSRTIATDILEAADDLAYAVHDIEDGIWARLIPIDQIVQREPWALDRIAAVVTQRYPGLFSNDQDVDDACQELFQRVAAEHWARGPFDRSRASEAGLKSFCSALTDELITSVTADGALHWHDNTHLQRRIALLKSVIWAWMVEQPELVTRRYGQRRVLRDLFMGYMDQPGMLPYQDEWQRVAERGEHEQARFVADHVASMTDTYASWVHSEMCGVASFKVPE